MEPEFLFSSSPFVTEDSGRFSVIKPTKTATVNGGLRHGKRSAGVTHQHVVINGRAVEVTEDAVGIAGLHLE